MSFIAAFEKVAGEGLWESLADVPAKKSRSDRYIVGHTKGKLVRKRVGSKDYATFFGRKDLIPGGLADHKQPRDFDAKSLKAGQKVESEHTSSLAIAKEIAMDHLTEDREYYRKLKKIEKK